MQSKELSQGRHLSHTQEWGEKAPSESGQTRKAGLLVTHCSSVAVSTMSGRVGDLSPKQAETLAKVRDPHTPQGKMAEEDEVERMARTLPPSAESASPSHCLSAAISKEGHIGHSQVTSVLTRMGVQGKAPLWQPCG